MIGRQVAAASYSTRVVLQPDGKLQLQLFQSGTQLGKTVSLGTYSVGQTVTVKLEVTGSGTTAVRAKAWTTGGEPAAWQATATDVTAALQAAGSVGLKVYTGSTAGAATVAFDGFRVTSLA